MRFINYELKYKPIHFPYSKKDYSDIDSFLLDIDSQLVQDVLHDKIQYRKILTHNDYDIIIGHNMVTNNHTNNDIIKRLTAYNVLVIDHETMKINLTLSHTIYIAHNFLHIGTIAFRTAFKHAYVADAYKTKGTCNDYDDDIDCETNDINQQLTVHHLKRFDGYNNSTAYVNLIKETTDILEVSFHLFHNVFCHFDNNRILRMNCTVTIDGYCIRDVFPQDILNILEMLGTETALSWRQTILDMFKPFRRLDKQQKESIANLTDEEYVSTITNLFNQYGCESILYNAMGSHVHEFPFRINGNKDEYEYQCIASICADKIAALVNNTPVNDDYKYYSKNTSQYRKFFSSEDGDVFISYTGSMYPFLKTRFGYIHTKHAHKLELIRKVSDKLMDKAQKKLGATAKLSGRKVQDVVKNLFNGGAKTNA